MNGYQARFHFMTGLVLSSLVSCLFVVAAAVPETVESQTELDQEIQYYYGARTVIDLTIPQLLQQYPDLGGVRPATSQDLVGPVLEKVGANVEAFFLSLPNTTCIEEVRQQRLNSHAKVTESSVQRFHYLVLADPEKHGSAPREYRTDSKGRPIESHVLPGDLSLMTQGFNSSSAYFDQVFQSDSDFRFLGTDDLDGRQTYVVLFAQRPQRARIISRLELQSGPIWSAVILVQGIAWIDQRSFQIVKLTTDLLKPRDDIGLRHELTEIEFAPVHFTRASADVWLPMQVVVTIDWRGKTYRNVHHYSSYKLFTVQTEERPKQGTSATAVAGEEREHSE